MSKINTKITKLPESMVEIEGTLSVENIEKFKTEAIKHFGETLDLKGFRKGHVPEDVVVKTVGEMAILEDSAERAIFSVYPEILAEHKIYPLGRPEIIFTKLAPGNDAEFKIKTPIMPEVELPDYKKIAKEIKEDELKDVTEEEVEKVVEDLRQMRAQQNAHQREHGDDPHAHGHDHTHEIKPEDLPELNDEFVKSFGDFKNVEEFKNKIKENLTEEKKNEVHGKRRAEILEKIETETKVDVPQVIVDSEIDKMMAQIESDISRAGITFEDYEKHSGKTKDSIREEIRPDAVKRARTQLAISKIADLEKITPDEEKVKAQVEVLMQMYPGADELRTRAYVIQVMGNEEVLRFLESQK